MSVPSDEERKAAQVDCTDVALKAGAKASAWAFATAGLLVATANQTWPAFRAALGVSGKTALVVSPAFGFFFLQSELAMSECARKKKWATHGKANPSDSLRDILPTRGA